MPTQIPGKTRPERAEWSKGRSGRYAERERSLLVEVTTISIHVLLAAAIIYGIAFVVIRAYM
jgi:hypothetical protein